jgi:hypothetical protein
MKNSTKTVWIGFFVGLAVMFVSDKIFSSK